jgi:hypothetical protein
VGIADGSSPGVLPGCVASEVSPSGTASCERLRPQDDCRVGVTANCPILLPKLHVRVTVKRRGIRLVSRHVVSGPIRVDSYYYRAKPCFSRKVLTDHRSPITDHFGCGQSLLCVIRGLLCSLPCVQCAPWTASCSLLFAFRSCSSRGPGFDSFNAF